MASLHSFKRRIKSIDSTSNIARAMELVSSVKLKKLKSKYDSTIRYLNCLQDVINEVLTIKNQAIKFNSEGLRINIVITSNLGLCGAYNEEIIRLVEKECDKSDSYIVFGEKGKNYLKNNGYDILFSYLEYDGFEDNEVQKEFSGHLFNLINEGKVERINVIYTKYINNLTFNVMKEQIYPFSTEKIGDSARYYLIEPDGEEMLKYLVSLLVKTKVNGVLLNSVLSENASRNNAMKKAKENADELKDNLSLVYNKMRQQNITTELSDIVNGM